jgi:hypothetical protein
MNSQQKALAARFQPEHNWEYAQQHGQPMPVANVRRLDHAISRCSSLPFAGEIDAALQRKYGAPRLRSTVCSS